MRQLNNEKLFILYDTDLVLRLHNEKNLKDTRRVLSEFKNLLNGRKPSGDLAKLFLSRYSDRKPRTLYRYAQMLKVFMKWYGKPMNDLKIKRPKSLPQYIEDSDIEKLLAAVKDKKSHKGKVERDCLIIELGIKAGLRREEISELTVGAIHNDFLIVIDSKNHKDRTIPLTSNLAEKLHSYIQGKNSQEKVFKLVPQSISHLVRRFADKAGLPHIHAHSLRHKYATDLVDCGADLSSLQLLMGHDNLSTTQVYIGLSDKRLRRSVDLLENKEEKTKAQDISANSINGNVSSPRPEVMTGAEFTEKTKYEETPHKRQIRKTSQILAESISLPSYWNKDMWKDLPVEFRPGEYSLPIGTVEIGTDKQIKVSNHNTGAGIAAPHLIKGLYIHLGTSGLPMFSELAGDKGRLAEWSSKVPRYLEALLKFLMTIAEEVNDYGTEVSFNDEAKSGLTKWFAITTWNDALQKAGGGSWIDDSWYQTLEHNVGDGLWQLKCGAYTIGFSKSKTKLEQYVRWHRRMRATYAERQLVKDIHAMRRDLGNIAQDLRPRLQEFSDMQHLPGQCELCTKT